MYNDGYSTSECSNDETRLGSVERFWGVRRVRVQDLFVTGLCQYLKMTPIMEDLHFTESTSCVGWRGKARPTPAASTICISFITDGLHRTLLSWADFRLESGFSRCCPPAL